MEDNTTPFEYEYPPTTPVRPPRSILKGTIHIVLFLATFFTTTLAGVLWVNHDPLDLSNFTLGLPYAFCLLAVLTAHEFGHFFAARYHNVDTTFPYYIPFPPFIVNPFGPVGQMIQLNPFGTMGAVIRIKSPLATRKALFDIGIAGPIAGLVVTLMVLAYAIITLPGKEYLYSIHPDYATTGIIPEGGLAFGNSIFFIALRYLVQGHGFLPPMNEIYHYPFLCVAWFGMFITALNLLPVGQLDGGHILYALIGKHQGIIARIFFGFLLILGLLSLLPFAGINFRFGSVGWLVWAGLLFFLIKIDHPVIYDDQPLSSGRRVLGWATMLLFILIFPPVPIFE